MKDINVYRQKKVNAFRNSVKDFKQEIDKLRAYLEDPTNSHMHQYYSSSIEEKEASIN
jgi:hypothetical protein